MNLRKFAMGKNRSLLAEEASATAMMRKASCLFCFMFLLFLHQNFNTVVAQPGELNFIFPPPKSFSSSSSSSGTYVHSVGLAKIKPPHQKFLSQQRKD
jgi:hypothetical protein